MKKVVRLVALTSIVLVVFLIPQMTDETTYFTSFAANFVFNHNLHEVVPARFFRSSSMNRSDLAEVIQKHEIHTVIDLRLSEDYPDESGKSEESVVEENGGSYYHIPMSSARADQLDELDTLLKIYETAPTPVLVHCSSGTHRSGIAAALWLLEKEHEPLDRAEEQISLRYGFIEAERTLKTYFQGNPTLDKILRRYAETARNEKISFRAWLDRERENREIKR